jgi:hypothetical protein
VELFWGPEYATAFVEQREPLDNRDDWLDEVWCEGGAVIDQDRQLLLWFGGEDIMHDVPLRRAHTALMQHLWTNWSIRWSYGAIAELGEYLDFPAEKFLSDLELDPAESFRILHEYPEDNDTLLTVRKDGDTSATRVSGDEESLELGENQAEILLGFPRKPHLSWTGEMPTGGVHIDLDNRTIYYWRADPAAAIEERVRRAWPSWQTEWLADKFARHLQIAGMNVHLPLRETSTLQRELIDSLRRGCQIEARNPALEISTRYERYKDAEINPWTYEARGSAGK